MPSILFTAQLSQLQVCNSRMEPDRTRMCWRCARVQFGEKGQLHWRSRNGGVFETWMCAQKSPCGVVPRYTYLIYIISMFILWSLWKLFWKYYLLGSCKSCNCWLHTKSAAASPLTISSTEHSFTQSHQGFCNTICLISIALLFVSRANLWTRRTNFAAIYTKSVCISLSWWSTYWWERQMALENFVQVGSLQISDFTFSQIFTNILILNIISYNNHISCKLIIDCWDNSRSNQFKLGNYGSRKAVQI